MTGCDTPLSGMALVRGMKHAWELFGLAMCLLCFGFALWEKDGGESAGWFCAACYALANLLRDIQESRKQ